MTTQPSSQPENPAPTDEVARARETFEQSLSALTDRLAPASLAKEASETAKLAAADAGKVVTGHGLPADTSRRRRAVAVLATGAIVAVGIASKILQRGK